MSGYLTPLGYVADDSSIIWSMSRPNGQRERACGDTQLRAQSELHCRIGLRTYPAATAGGALIKVESEAIHHTHDLEPWLRQLSVAADDNRNQWRPGHGYPCSGRWEIVAEANQAPRNL